MAVKEKHCTPCEKGTKPLSNSEEESSMQALDSWKLHRDGTHGIQKQFSFNDFKDAMAFVNRIADIANEENHHPDITISYNKVTIELTTHKIGGLSDNDFILAEKIDDLISEHAM